MTRSTGKVLVTGARGFIGTYCLPLLIGSGFDVVAVSAVDETARLPGIRWRQCNLLDREACGTLIAEERPTHILHLAWITTPGVFWNSRENLAWLGAGIDLAETFYASGGQRFVGLGSCAEYALSDLPCVEDETPLVPATVYGKAKAAMCLAVQAAAQERGSYAWARLFFPYGPGEPAERFIPAVIDGLLEGKPVKCTHGNQERDFVFAADVAEACVALLCTENSGAYNVGGGSAVSLRTIANLLVKQLGHADLVRFGEREAPPFDPQRIVADITKICREVGWVPRTQLEEGLRKTVEASKARRS